MNKYRNQEVVTFDGIKHASRKEADRWCELKLLERSGKISELKRQVKFTLIPAQYEVYERYSKSGKRLKDGQRCIEKACEYIADFVYRNAQSNEIVVEDTKGFRTEKYIIKRKLMLYIHHIRIREV